MEKIPYLKKLQEQQQKYFSSEKISTQIDGASPPSVFIGSWNYPKVFLGPLFPKIHGDTRIMDSPELWKGRDVSDIVVDRMSLIRGKKSVGIFDDNKYVQRLREMVLSKNSVDVETTFEKTPVGGFFHEEMMPFGPSAEIKDFSIHDSKFDKKLEKAHYDTDLKASDAVKYLYEKNILVSSIQKAVSMGSFGIKRKLVPTRWSITMVDDVLSNTISNEIKNNTRIEKYMVFEHKEFGSRFVILLTPTDWKYEMIEAFIKVLGSEEVLFSDFETHSKKKTYSKIGGAYYSGRLAVAEKLREMKLQSGAIVFRECYPEYVPLGVWSTREIMRTALSKKAESFDDMKSALNKVFSYLKISMSKYFSESNLLKQTTLKTFI